MTPRVLNLYAPCWAVVSFLGIAVSIPWLHWLPCRFNLRTLLIATTLIAVVLGLIVWLR